MSELLEQIRQEKERRSSQGESVPLMTQIQEEKRKRALAKENEPFYQPALETLADVGETIDSYTGAPTRAAIGKLIEGEVLSAPGAFVSQFGEDPTKAPTGKQLAVQAGIPEDVSLTDISPEIPGFLQPGYSVDRDLEAQGFKIKQEPMKLIESGDPLDISPAGAAGLGVDIVGDVSNLIPGVMVVKGAKAGVKGARTGLKGLQKGGRATKEFILKNSAKARAVNDSVETTLDIANNAGKSVKKSLRDIVRPTRAADFDELTEIAVKNNIDTELLPEAIEFGEDSFVSRQARHVAEGPLGAEKLKKFKQARADVDNAVFDKVKSFGDGAEVMDDLTAGHHLRESYDKAAQDFFDQMDVTYAKIAENKPNMLLTPDSLKEINNGLEQIEEYALKQAEVGITTTQRSQGVELLNAIEAVRNRGDNFEEAVEALQTVGKVAYKTSSSLAELPSDIKNLQKIYRTLKKGITDSVRFNLGDDIADQLVNNNKAMTDFFSNESNIAKVLGNKDLSEELVYKKLVKNGSVKQVEALRRVLDPESFNRIKSSYLNDVISTSSTNGVRYTTSLNRLARDPKIASMFTPNEIKEISDLLKLGDRMGSPVLSSSGTGASNVFSDIGRTIRTSVENETVLEALKKKGRKVSAKAAKEAPKSAAKASESAVKTKSYGIAEMLDKPVVRRGATAARVSSTQRTNKKRKNKRARNARK